MPLLQQSNLNSRRWRALIALSAVIIGAVVIWQATVRFWPQPKVALNQHYTALNAVYTFSCPTTWQVASYNQPAGVVTTATFKIKGAAYSFVISPPGQLGSDADNLSRDSGWFTYGGTKFYRTVLRTSGKPFYVAATTPASSYVVTMQLPPSNVNYYLSVFGQVLATLRFANS